MFLLVALLISSISRNALAQSFPSQVPKENLVINGYLLSKEGVWSADETTIYTINWIKPKAVFQGVAQRDSIPVLTPGGMTDEGLLVVTHSFGFQTSSDYLLALEPCADCIKGLTTYVPVGAIADFNREAYLHELNNWRTKQRVVKGPFPCDTEKAVLYLTFGNIHLNLLGQVASGYVDIMTKTPNPKTLQSLHSKLSYEAEVFGTYAVSSENVSVSMIGLGSAYSTTSSDLTFDKASFSITRNSGAFENAVINSSYQSSIRISFVTSAANLQNLPSELSELFKLEELTASFLCDGKEYPFEDIIIEEKQIGVDIDGTVESGIVYEFQDITFEESSNTYSFTVFASTSEETYLNVSNVKIDFSENAFLPFQVDNGHFNIMPAGNSVLNNNIYSVDFQDLGTSSIEISVFPDNTDDIFSLEVLNDTPKALYKVSLEIEEEKCQLNPELVFLSGDMQGQSTYFPPTSTMPLVFDPVLAIDQENTPPCGCNGDPILTGISHDSPLIAGDDQVLTITGNNFGVYERTGTPGNFGTGSSVLFTNGDMGLNDPQYIPASNTDIISWTNTEIKVKIPSVGHVQGIEGTAASGNFIVRNRCNNLKFSDSDLFSDGLLNIPYSLATYRIFNDGPARKLGLRNDNGSNGEQDGYVFAFGSNITGGNVNINIEGAFGEALKTWCEITDIRFKTQQADSPTNMATPNDGVNSITIEDFDDPDIEAGMVQSFSYFPINCEATQSNENGGYILSDIDFIISPDFAETASQSQAIETLIHELGHAHLLNHALCPGANCTQPIMEAFGGAGAIQTLEGEGAKRIFERSAGIIDNNQCSLIGTPGAINPVPIKQGGCGDTNPALESVFTDIRYSPNPTSSSVDIFNLPHSGRFSLFSSTGQLLSIGDTPAGEYNLDLSAYPKGTYFLNIIIDTTSGHIKVIKI